MELTVLRYVLAVVDEGGFTRAAESRHVTQSALSHAIAALEREIGVRLFDRASRTVTPTEAGEAFLRHAREAVDAADRARDEAVATAGEIRGVLRIGVIPTVTAVDLPAALLSFRREHPHARVELTMGNSDQHVPAVRAGRLDVALLGLREGVEPTGVAVRVLSRARLVVAVDDAHPLAGRRSVTLDELRGESFADFPAETSGRQQSDRAFAAAGITRDVAFESATADLILDLVRVGLAVALLPAGVVSQVPGVEAVEVEDGPMRTEYAVWHARAPRAAARAFLPYLGVR